MEFVHVVDAKDKMHATSAFEHRLELLDECQTQRTRTNRGDWRLGVEILRLDFKSKFLVIKPE